jgi:hypothetical protein
VYLRVQGFGVHRSGLRQKRTAEPQNFEYRILQRRTSVEGRNSIDFY